MDQKALAQMGFKLNRNSTHTARTIMVSELNLLFEYIVDHNATIDDYVEAIVHDNCLYKRSMSNRKITAKHLVELYALDKGMPIFRALRHLWHEDEASRPLLALLCAITRDSLLHNIAHHYIDVPPSTVITREDTERWVNDMEPGRFSEVTLRSTAKNLNSSWTQSGHLVGRVQKIRIKPDSSTGATAFALFLGYLSSFRGMQLFQSEYVRVLDCSEYEAINLAQEAAQKGLLTFKKLGNIVEVGFPNILTPQDKELLV